MTKDGWTVSPVLGDFIPFNIQKETPEMQSYSRDLSLNITLVHFNWYFPTRVNLSSQEFLDYKEAVLKFEFLFSFSKNNVLRGLRTAQADLWITLQPRLTLALCYLPPAWWDHRPVPHMWLTHDRVKPRVPCHQAGAMPTELHPSRVLVPCLCLCILRQGLTMHPKPASSSESSSLNSYVPGV